MSAHSHLARLAALAVGAAITASACAGGSSRGLPAADAATSVVTTTTVAPSPPSSPTTTPTTTPATTTSATMTPPTYTLPPTTLPLPQPIAPPADDESPEPVVPLGSIAIPAIGIDRPLYEGIRLPTFNLGPGHWPGSALPGQLGNMVIGGHRTSHHADFRNIDRLQPGDQVIVNTGDGGRYTYLVDSVEITDPFATRLVYQTESSTATLFACHPPGSTDHRVVVHLSLAA